MATHAAASAGGTSTVQLEEYEDRLRRVGVKRVGDLELLSPED
eukprot:COSAG04_NODE_15243_length_538_cov_1.608200_2_plen_42_part_01